MDNKRHLGDAHFAAAIHYLESKYDLTIVRGDHFTDWYLDNKQVACACDSIYPGPHHGSIRWVDRSLTQGAEVVVRRSRFVNHTESHIINERIDYQRRHGRPQPATERITMIPEVERTYEAIMANGGFSNRVEAGSFSIYWNECVVIN